ncbi:hypothetical protein EDB85DRAFT_2160516 [Lactarius pseudohatsudake]|nr:hypothetical protein EDB85DRAFT_2160516 [Lactarius pseudohatsudake]
MRPEAEQAPRVFPRGCTTFLEKKLEVGIGHSKGHSLDLLIFAQKYMSALQKHVTTDKCTFYPGVHALRGEKYIAELEHALSQTRNRTTLEFS